jgi:hypothetical protein
VMHLKMGLKLAIYRAGDVQQGSRVTDSVVRLETR